VKRWLLLVGELVNMTSILDQQDEHDRESLALVGVKGTAFAPGSNLKESFAAKDERTGGSIPDYGTAVARLDATCLTCCANPGEKRLLLEQFKMACLQYRPSDVIFPDRRPRSPSRGGVTKLKRKDALKQRQQLVDQLLAE